MQQSIIKEAEAAVTKIFEEFSDSKLVFHNLAHTEDVADKSFFLASQYRLSQKQKEDVVIAAWFHDVGYLFTIPQLHEEKGAEMAVHWLESKSFDPERTAEIREIILATKLPVSPQTLLQAIICDADTFHLGTDEFQHSDRKVFEEFCHRNKDLTEEQFRKGTLAMMKSHQYYTEYCREKLVAGKEINIKVIV